MYILHTAPSLRVYHTSWNSWAATARSCGTLLQQTLQTYPQCTCCEAKEAKALQNEQCDLNHNNVLSRRVVVYGVTRTQLSQSVATTHAVSHDQQQSGQPTSMHVGHESVLSGAILRVMTAAESDTVDRKHNNLYSMCLSILERPSSGNRCPDVVLLWRER